MLNPLADNTDEVQAQTGRLFVPTGDLEEKVALARGQGQCTQLSYFYSRSHNLRNQSKGRHARTRIVVHLADLLKPKQWWVAHPFIMKGD